MQTSHRMKAVAVSVVVLAAVAAAQPVAVSAKQSASENVPPRSPPLQFAQGVWESTTLDSIADDVMDVTDARVFMVDNQSLWNQEPRLGGPDTLGLVRLNNTGGLGYHSMILAPTVYDTFVQWLSTGSTVGNEYDFALAAIVLVHEGFHWRLMSSDESTVNACALKYLPYYLINDFGIQQTITETTYTRVPLTRTVTVLVSRVVYVKKRMRSGGRWVTRRIRTIRHVYVKRKVTTYQQTRSVTSVENPEYTKIVSDSQQIYSGQPPPYNSGTCSV